MQMLRAHGVDRARAGVVDALADLLGRALYFLGERARHAAEIRGCGRCDVEDLHAAMDLLHMDEEVLLEWCKGQPARELRRVAGEGVDDSGTQVGADWLDRLVERQVKSGDSFIGTILGEANEGERETAGHQEAMERLGDVLR